MNVENFIESQYRRLDEINEEYIDLYQGINHAKLREILSTLHWKLVSLFNLMNNRLPTNSEYGAHFWAGPSRELIKAIDIIENLQRVLQNTSFAFNLDEYHQQVIMFCKSFLKASGGSLIPPGMDKIVLYYTIPIFIPKNGITVINGETKKSYELKLIGEGSYAQVFKYKDEFYQKTFVLKRAKKDLNEKEIIRFKREFEQMKSLNSPYIVEVYCYNEAINEYIMEYMDMTLDHYITKNNGKLNLLQRKNICYQILKAFSYIHSKGLLHRDISPKNILVKEYEDVLVVKVADFGLVRIQESNLTTLNTEFKGYFNDPSLIIEGFDKYNTLHETYALTRILLYVMTGKSNATKIEDSNLKAFVDRGLNPDKNKRFQNIEELYEAFKKL
ncbi:MAG TPA: protein kinase family protein [Bacillota bacterium]|nr:protein kinase family protein [Bacillota bacterium]HPT88319.1 protein kinase family protein [Bacillota bacterium]